eukprot:360734_1
MAMKEKKGGWNISHGPVGPVCAFNHNPYNEVVEDVWYQQLYPLPLSRYNHQVSGNVAELFVINLASEPPMGPSSPKAAAPQEYDATLHPITTSSLLPSIAVSIWVEYSFGPSGVRLSPLSQKGGSHNNMTFQAGYGRQLIRYLKSPIQPFTMNNSSFRLEKEAQIYTMDTALNFLPIGRTICNTSLLFSLCQST